MQENGNTAKLQGMKAALDIPDDLYRRVKARSAMEGCPVRSVAIQLFQNRLDAPRSDPAESSGMTVDPAKRGIPPQASLARSTRHRARQLAAE